MHEWLEEEHVVALYLARAGNWRADGLSKRLLAASDITPGSLGKAVANFAFLLRGHGLSQTSKPQRAVFKQYGDLGAAGLRKAAAGRLERLELDRGIRRPAKNAQRFWRMSFKAGNRGYSLWSQCKARQAAVITYDQFHEFDLGPWPTGEPESRWTQLEASQKYSLDAVRYQMRVGDVIYAKDGPFIVGRGTVKRNYRFEPDVLGDRDYRWGHHVQVAWQSSFPATPIPAFGPRQNTVFELSPAQARSLDKQIDEDSQPGSSLARLEGRLSRCWRALRARDRRIIEAKKQSSNMRCEVCGIKFAEVYGPVGENYIVVHHTKPIGLRRRASLTRLSELILVCQNCHAMLHQRVPPLTKSKLRSLLRRFGLLGPESLLRQRER